MPGMKQTVAVTALALAGSANAFWRLPCRGRTGLGRIDPIMDANTISDHVHTIHGGNNFGMGTTPEDLLSSNCTSCSVTQDHSAYWTPSLHFMYPNGTTVIVPQVGGMLAYYLLYGDDIQAFPQDFMMVAGDKRQRNFTYPVPDPPKSEWSGDQASQAALRQKALGFNCLNYAANPEASLYRHFLPDKDYLDANCLDGIRLELMFPACWNGKGNGADGDMSHMAYPNAIMGGTCPDGYDTWLPSLFYETIWNTYAFAGVEGQFVLSTGDPTGYGYHGDFMMGWEKDFLQSAIETCTNVSGEIQDCPLFDIQSDSDSEQCFFDEPSVIADDNPAGPRDGLAINVPIQAGPGYATTYSVVGASAATSIKPSQATSAYSSAVRSASANVPTLTYSSATETKSDKYGGGILMVATDSSSAPESSSAVASSYQQKEAVVSTSAAISTSVALSTSVAASTVTAAPSLESAAAYNPNIVATSYITKGNEVVEVMIEEVEVTVTATASPTAQHKRHLNQHRRGRRDFARR